MLIILSDNQDITRAGMMYLLRQMGDYDLRRANDKAGLMELLRQDGDAVVVMDYTLGDINDADELLVMADCFAQTRWVLFSEDLSIDFVKRVVGASRLVSVLLKESPINEIRECLRQAIKGGRLICQRTAEMMFTVQPIEEKSVLTKTETEILKEIALGSTTKEIAEKRFSSFHTVNTHRKNIFRKLGLNNAHEATKYALRAGLIDSAEYYI